jgi:hypothetical protein
MMGPGSYPITVGDGGTADTSQGAGGKGIVIVRYTI